MSSSITPTNKPVYVITGAGSSKKPQVNPPAAQIIVPRGAAIDDSTHRLVQFPDAGVVAIPNSLSDEDANDFARFIHEESKKYQQRGK
jgi:hypothetical protein